MRLTLDLDTPSASKICPFARATSVRMRIASRAPTRARIIEIRSIGVASNTWRYEVGLRGIVSIVELIGPSEIGLKNGEWCDGALRDGSLGQ